MATAIVPKKKTRAARQSKSTPKALTAAAQKTVIDALGAGAWGQFVIMQDFKKVADQERLSHWRQVGQYFLTVEEKFREQGLTTFATQLGYDHRDVRLAMRLAEEYDEESMKALQEEAVQRGGHVAWGHMRRLLALKDPAERAEYLELIKTQVIGQDKAKAVVSAGKAVPKKKAKGGRKFNIPSTLKDARAAGLRQLGGTARFFTQFRTDVRPTLDKIDQDRWDGDLLAQIQEIRVECDTVIAAVQATRDMLHTFEQQIEQKLGLQPPAAPSASENGATPAKIIRRPPAAARTRSD